MIFRLLYAIIYSALIVILTGFPQAALAVVSCQDTINPNTSIRYIDALVSFKAYNGKTYAVAKSAATGGSSVAETFFDLSANITRTYLMTGDSTGSLKNFLSLGQYGAATPVKVDSADTQQFILHQFGKYLGTATTPQSTYIDAWKEFGSGGFTAMDGTALSFTNWASPVYTGQDPQAVVMGADGRWTSGLDGARSAQIVQFEGVLDCATDFSPSQSGTGTTTTPPPAGSSGPDLSHPVCGQDLNGNGYAADPGEIANCSQTAQGLFCPVGSVNCVESYSAPVCPAGSTLNTARDMCQADATVTCGSGYVYDASIDKCVEPVTCPDGGTFNRVTDQCEKLVMNQCPSGYTYDSIMDACRKSADCSGGTLSPTKDRCETPPTWNCPSGFSYNASSGKCEATPYCPPGTAYDAGRNRCEASLGSCPAGYTYNIVLDKCTAAVSCSSGGSLNSTTDTCEITSSTSCLAGTIYNPATGKCETPPTCPSPGTYNKTYDLCLTSSTGTTCPGGYTYNLSYGTCISSPSCVAGSYSASKDRCESALIYSCSDPSYSYNSARGKCEKPPTCPVGTYNVAYDKCLQPANTSCPAGYSWNAGRTRCEKSPPECSAGSTYNTATNKCESGGSYQATLSGGVYYSVPIYTKQGFVSSNRSCGGDTGFFTLESATDYTYYFGTYQTISCPSYLKGYISSTSFPGSVPLYTEQYADMGESNLTCYGTDTDILTINSASTDYYVYCYNYLKGHIPATSFPGSVPLYTQQFAYSGVCYGTDTGTPMSSSTNAVCPNYLKGYIAPSIGTYGDTYSCPSGGTLSGTNCYTTNQTNPTCTGGTFDGYYDVCWTSLNTTCANGSIYDSSIGQCVSTPTCSNGLLDGGTDVCYQSASSGCTSGYSLSGGVCIASVSCGSGGSLNSSIDYCTGPATYSCPSGYSYSATYGQCYRAADCGAGSLNGSLDVCQQAYSLACPSGYTLNGVTCQTAPTCAGGGSYNASLNLCDGGANICGSPLTLDPAVDTCFQAATCSGGTLNTGNDRCESAPAVSCGSWSWDSAAQVCFSPPVCNLGAYDAAGNECRATVTRNCGTYGWASTQAKCTHQIVCPTDDSYALSSTVLYSSTLDECVSDTQHACPAGTTYNGLPIAKCEAVPICTGDGIYNTTVHGCFLGMNTCPLGTQHTCMDNNGTMQCSPNPCFTAGTSGTEEITTMDETMMQDDGQRDQDGNCLDQLYVFNGKGSRCRPPGLTVGQMNNCCESDEVGSDDTGSNISTVANGIQTAYELGQVAYYGNALAAGTAQIASVSTTASGAISSMTVVTASGSTATLSGATATGAYGALASGATGAEAITAGISQYAAALFNPTTIVVAIVVMVVMKVLFGNGCDQGDIQTGMQAASKDCHYIGDYCEKKWPLVGCVQKAKSYCCFNTKMARIIHEQGRPQLQSFGADGGWGTPISPNCRGFTPDEFQSLDFSRIDLSEYFGDLRKDLDKKIQGAQSKIQNKVQQKFQATTGVN